MKNNTHRWRKISRSLPSKPCIICGETFKLRSGVQRVCTRCRNTQVVCSCGCGQSIPKYTYSKSTKTYERRTFAHGHNNYGENNPRWNGGVRLLQNRKYRAVLAPTHPAAHSSGYVYEHRRVMEQHLGRLLSSDEVVHHINGNTHDNRVENLQVMSHAEHARLHLLERHQSKKSKQ